jgi:hypothetical protein
MKKNFTLLFIFFAIFFINNQVFSQSKTAAVDFNLTDCDGFSCQLFPVLDSNNIVILLYEHQCSSCITGANNIKTVINNNYSSNTNIKIMYLDNGGFSCASTKTWISSHGFLPGRSFAYSNTYSSPYGSGMPVLVVIGPNHNVYLTATSAAASSTTAIQTAIAAALNDMTGVATITSPTNTFTISPNPVKAEFATLNYGSYINQTVRAEIMNIAGKVVANYSIEIEKGDSYFRVPVTDLENGIYIVRLETASGNFVKKMIVNR